MNPKIKLSLKDASTAGPASHTEPNCGRVPFRYLVYIALSLLAVETNFLIGKELGWDVLNYHFYSGFSAIHSRFSQDYFAAGAQSYFNPYAYAPFYLLVNAGLPALLIASLLAAVQSAILWLTFELGVCVSPSKNPRIRLVVGICASAFAFVNPILIQEFGSSFTDITTGELVLAGWVLLALAVRSPSAARVILAGLIIGAACALKLTNSVHAIAGFAVLVALPSNIGSRIRQWIYFGLSLASGFALTGAAWSYHLEAMFGNPFFPLLNNVFRSPEFTTEPLRHYRFIPDTLPEALWRPFAMLDPSNMVHSELRAPDLRYAVLLLLIVIVLARWSARGRANEAIFSPNGTDPTANRVLGALIFGVAVDWALWLSGSGNSRYFIPGACVAGVAIIGLLFRLFPARPKQRNYALLVIFGVQAIQLWLGTDYRWHSVSWGGPWFDVAVPPKLKLEPNLFLTIGGQTNSFIAPYLARSSGLINISGGYVLGSGGESGARIKALEDKYGSNLRVLVRGKELHEDSDGKAPRRSQIDTALSPFQLQVEKNDCATIAVNGLPPELEITLQSQKQSQEPALRPAENTTFLLSCRLIHGSSDYSARRYLQQSADLALDHLEDTCPALFQPRRPLTEFNGRQFLRRYTNTDLVAWVSGGELKFTQIERGSRTTNLGHERSWVTAQQRVECGRRNGLYFANPIGPR